ncbi:hypothetical protein C5167_037921 [Papaver somniferum]|uniref:Uncharacterized protein n=1 Tax=Papaver somniferum TaxID=3469 RepID=A0A4Y7IB75_PAPSO|nr:hypothetical protein C5167_037921 [Papaver somniferum]
MLKESLLNQFDVDVWGSRFASGLDSELAGGFSVVDYLQFCFNSYKEVLAVNKKGRCCCHGHGCEQGGADCGRSWMLLPDFERA